jgi:hypothetical protein
MSMAYYTLNEALRAGDCSPPLVVPSKEKKE